MVNVGEYSIHGASGYGSWMQRLSSGQSEASHDSDEDGICIYPLPETNSSHPEHRPSQRKQSYSIHPFSGAKMLVSGSVKHQKKH